MATVFVMVAWLLGCLTGMYIRKAESSFLRNELHDLEAQVNAKQMIIEGQGERIAQLVERGIDQ